MFTDHRNAYAAVVTYWFEASHSYRFIVHASNPSDYVRQLAEAMRDAIGPLIDHFYRRFDVGANDELRDAFSDVLETQEPWQAEQLATLVNKLPQLAVEEFDQSGSTEVLKSLWYRELIGFVNQQICEESAGLFITIAGSLPEFLPQLLELESRRQKRASQIADSEAIWLGKLAAIIHRPWTEQTIQDHWLVVNSLFAAFDERNSEFYG